MTSTTQNPTTRRTLHFTSIHDALAEARRLAAVESAGTLHYAGTWKLGTILNHLAAWAEFPYEGYPLTVPWYIRFLSRLFKKRFLTKGLTPGVKIPGVKGGTLATEPVPTSVGLSRFEKAFARLAKEPPELPNPLFGKLSHDEWIALHLRHAELHISFASA